MTISYLLLIVHVRGLIINLRDVQVLRLVFNVSRYPLSRSNISTCYE